MTDLVILKDQKNRQHNSSYQSFSKIKVVNIKVTNNSTKQKSNLDKENSNNLNKNLSKKIQIINTYNF